MAKTEQFSICMCGTAFVARKTKDTWQRYCCRGCSNHFTARQRGDKLRGRGSGKARCPYLAGKPIYRTLVEWALGCTLPPYICIHHRDGNPLNNELSNLMLVTRAEHCRLHQPQLIEGRRKAAVRRAANAPTTLHDHTISIAA